MSEEIWARLLSLRGKADFVDLPDDPAFALYGPIACATDPFVLAQVGQSLDGRVATPSGDARDISGPEGIAHLHRCRALVDAVIVGVGTVKNDDPRLSVREVRGPDPVRVVVDCNGELTGSETIFHDQGAPVILFQSDRAPVQRYPGAEVIRLERQACGLDPVMMLEALRARSLTRILVEGGARTISRFIEKGLVDRLHVSIAPLIIGAGPSGISLAPIETLATAQRPETMIYGLGRDMLFDCLMKTDVRDGEVAGNSPATQQMSPALGGGEGEHVRVANHA